MVTLFLWCLALGDFAQAQMIKKNNVVFTISSNIGLNFQSSFMQFGISNNEYKNVKNYDADGYASIGINSSAQLGFFISNNTMLGIGLDMGAGNINDEYHHYDNLAFAIGPHIKYVLDKKNIKPFMSAQILYGMSIYSKGSHELKDFTWESIISEGGRTLNIGYNVGFATPIAESITVNASILYQYNNMEVTINGGKVISRDYGI